VTKKQRREGVLGFSGFAPHLLGDGAVLVPLNGAVASEVPTVILHRRWAVDGEEGKATGKPS